MINDLEQTRKCLRRTQTVEKCLKQNPNITKRAYVQIAYNCGAVYTTHSAHLSNCTHTHTHRLSKGIDYTKFFHFANSQYIHNCYITNGTESKFAKLQLDRQACQCLVSHSSYAFTTIFPILKYCTRYIIGTSHLHTIFNGELINLPFATSVLFAHIYRMSFVDMFVEQMLYEMRSCSIACAYIVSSPVPFESACVKA